MATKSKEETNNAANANPWPKLVPALRKEILYRLPVKSLLRFKCVSKAWCSFISSPEFVRAHLRITSEKSDLGHFRFILNRQGHEPFVNDYRGCLLHSVSQHELQVESIDVNYPLKDSKDRMRFVGSCNGLVCIAIEHTSVLLWNPSTRKLKRLPILDIDRTQTGQSFLFSDHVFDYDQSCDDYRVVALLRFMNRRQRLSNTELWIYTLSTNSWIVKLNFPHVGSCKSVSFANGVVYCVYYCRVSDELVLTFLDILNNTHGQLMLPQSINSDDIDTRLTLAAVVKSLYLLYDFPGNRLDLWMRKVDGREGLGSWSKKATIPYLPRIAEPVNWLLLCIPNKSKFLLKMVGISSMQFVLYHEKEDRITFTGIENFPPRNNAHVYIESLVSPLSDSDDEVQTLAKTLARQCL